MFYFYKFSECSSQLQRDALSFLHTDREALWKVCSAWKSISETGVTVESFDYLDRHTKSAWLRAEMKQNFNLVGCIELKRSNIYFAFCSFVCQMLGWMGGSIHVKCFLFLLWLMDSITWMCFSLSMATFQVIFLQLHLTLLIALISILSLGFHHEVEKSQH